MEWAYEDSQRAYGAGIWKGRTKMYSLRQDRIKAACKTESENEGKCIQYRSENGTEHNKGKVTGLAKGDRIASWTSGNNKIVTVNSSGKIRAGKKTGNAKISVKLQSGLQKQIAVKLQKTPVKTTKIQGIQKKIRLRKKKSCTLVPQILPITSVEKITFTSSKKKVATVTSNGKVTAKKKGTAVITVKSGKIKVKCKITVR